MADINSSSFDSTTTGSTYGNKKTPTTDYSSSTSSDYSLDSGSHSEHSLYEEAYETAMDGLKSAGTFVKNNWMMIAGVGVVLGVGAYFFRDSLPIIGKAKRKAVSPSFGKSSLVKAGVKAASKAVGGKNKRSHSISRA